jgi:RNA polymerase sigma-70 factor (ECF subfamily)
MALTVAAALPFGSDIDDVRTLVELAKSRDQVAFSELYRRFSRAVHGVLLARLSRSDAEDLVQDSFLIAWQRIGELRDPGAFGGWMLAIARRLAIDHARRSPQVVELPASLAAQAVEPSDGAFVLSVIRALPDAYRETLILRFVEGMTGPEIAAATGLTEGSVRVNLHRGMKKLRERLEERKR